MIKEITEAQKLDILLGLSKEFSLKETEDPASYTMNCGGGYTLNLSIKTAWTFTFNDGVETTEYNIDSAKVPFTNAKDARKLHAKYENECKRVLAERRGESIPDQKELESEKAEMVDDIEEKMRILEALERGEIQKPENTPVQKRQEPLKRDQPTQKKQAIQTKTLTVPANVRDKQVSELTQEDIINFICPKATLGEAMIFLKLCQARGINPFLKEAYLIKYDNQDSAQMVVARDYFARKAEEHPMYDGYESGIILLREEGIIERREGMFMLPDEKLVGGWCKVFRNDRTRPTISEVALHEYQQRKKDGTLNKFWSDKIGKPATMIEKVAFAQCHRKAFPGDFSGMYDRAELLAGVENLEGLDEEIIEVDSQEVEA